ncbi:MAG: hypothetical protein ABSH28_04795 [Acidobacteriota bacterium]
MKNEAPCRGAERVYGHSVIDHGANDIINSIANLLDAYMPGVYD